MLEACALALELSTTIPLLPPLEEAVADGLALLAGGPLVMLNDSIQPPLSVPPAAVWHVPGYPANSQSVDAGPL
jgi:hypothetical protein